jgi:hypothetical protein
MFLLVLVVLALPAIQQHFRVFPEMKTLSGDYRSVQKPAPTWDNWYRGEYQDQLERYLKGHAGFGSFLIRLRNQVDYSLFGLVHAEGVIKGNNKEHFESDYIRAFTGLDFVGESIIDKKIRRLKFLQTYLKDSLDTDLLFVLEPDKASLFPERIPDKYLQKKQAVTNYQKIVEKADLYDLEYIDLNRWFIQLKNQVSHPLYGQYATHWSDYAATLALDSLLNYIGPMCEVTFPDIITDSMVVEEYARDIDYDIGRAMNLMIRYKDRYPLAYPALRLERHPETSQTGPRVLVVADSYYWNIHNTGIPYNTFEREEYWYFGKLVYPESYSDTTFVDVSALHEDVENNDVILLMTTGRFLYKFDWYLTNRLFQLYGIQSTYDRSFTYLDNILHNEEWFRSCIRDAKVKGISLEEQLLAVARYTYMNEDPYHYKVMHQLSDIEKSIRGDAHWMREIERKAKEKNISTEKMIKLDAAYLLSENHPDTDSVYRSLQAQKKALLEDPEEKAFIQEQAKYYRVSFDEMLQFRAERTIKR